MESLGQVFREQLGQTTTAAAAAAAATATATPTATHAWDVPHFRALLPIGEL